MHASYGCNLTKSAFFYNRSIVICSRMKRILAVLILILYTGYVSGILLVPYNQRFHLICLNERNVEDCCSKKAEQSSNQALLDKISAHYSSALYSHTAAAGKTKLPAVFSGPVVAAGFTLSHFESVSTSSTRRPAQPVTQLTPVFLQNCVLRL